MRKIKLQMTTSIDGFVKPKHAEQTSPWDDKVTDFCIDNLEGVDSILLGRNTAEGFIDYWAGVAANPQEEYHRLGKPLTDIPKVVFSNSIKGDRWNNATIVGGKLKTAIEDLKSKPGKDVMVYGGYSFVSSLIQHGLVDEFHLLVYPYAAGDGEPIFKKTENNVMMTLKSCRSFHCGIVLLSYEKQKNS